MSDVTHVTASPGVFTKPTAETPSYKVESFYPNRWPLMLKGRDESGRERVLALDWDSRWHDLSPGRPAPRPRTQRADQFNVGDRAVIDGRVVTRMYAEGLGQANVAFCMVDHHGEHGERVPVIVAGEQDLEVAP